MEKIELFKLSHASQDRYVYFTLTATMAAIGFAITQTNYLKINISQIPLGIALLCWSISFFFGCKNRGSSICALHTNLLNLYDENNHTLTNEFKRFSKKSEKYWNRQSRMFFMGTIFYIIWHIYEMYLRSLL